MQHQTTDIIESLAIDHLMAQRDAALQKFAEGMLMVQESIKDFEKFLPRVYYSRVEDIIKEILPMKSPTLESNKKSAAKTFDRDIWTLLFEKTGLKTIMSSKQIDEWQSVLYSSNMPEANYDNICTTFKTLYASRGNTLEQGIIDVYRSLSWDYKTNNPCKIEKKIIINNVLSCSRYLSFNHNMQPKLDDLLRPFYIFDGKPVPDCRVAFGDQLRTHIDNVGINQKFENEYVSVKVYLKGSAHITFKRMDTVEKLNEIIAKHYPGMLSATNK